MQLARINRQSPEVFLNLRDERMYAEMDRLPIVSLQKVPAPARARPAAPLPRRREDPGAPARGGRTPCHLFVFVHGLMGSASDLRTFRDALVSRARAHEGAGGGAERTYHYLMSSWNQDKTFECFTAQGDRLAAEVTNCINANFSAADPRYLDRLSFVGHSIGNIVIRSALAHKSLRELWPRLWSYTSISGPHLGYLYSDNRLLRSGMRILERLNESESMAQLSMTDAPAGGEPPYMQRLANHEGLSLFRHVVLVASKQDRYVPYHSARIEMPPAHARAGVSRARSDVVGAMIDGVMGRMFVAERSGPPGGGAAAAGTELTLVDVSFSALLGKIDLIGRRAHIEFLRNKQYVDTLVWTLDAVYE